MKRRFMKFAYLLVFLGIMFGTAASAATGIQNGGFEREGSWQCTNCDGFTADDLMITQGVFKGNASILFGRGIGIKQITTVSKKKPLHRLSFYHVSDAPLTVRIKNAKTGKLLVKQKFSATSDWTEESLTLPARATGKKVVIAFSNKNELSIVDTVKFYQVKWPLSRFIVKDDAGDAVDGLAINIRDKDNNLVTMKLKKNGKKVTEITTGDLGTTGYFYAQTNPKHAKMCTVSGGVDDCLPLYDKDYFNYGKKGQYSFSFY